MNRRNFLKKLSAINAGIAIETMIPKSIFSQESKKYKEIWVDIEGSVNKLKTKFNLRSDEIAIIIDPSKQMLYLIKGKEILKIFPISTSKAGIGSESGSGKTPPGVHRIKEKYGDNAKPGTIFKARVNTGRVAKISTDEIDVPKDKVTTRIMRLKGQEKGINKGENIDSYKRCIYIHGTSEEGLIGKPSSHGCIRMKNDDIIKLYNLVSPGTLVEIQNKKFVKNK